ncbi:unnamed protein product [Protopolystoma xenopodis]|uniref:Uncharacterized protein n=1 Tax=Protopolystoma xenopodis TaxID=117903 RepID=A0A448XDV2_9PLAT|nr:unnamed protein product [Protopolystoma xenopodis]
MFASILQVVDENDEVPQIIASFIRPGAGEGDAEAGVKRLKYLSRYTEQPSVLENQPVNTLIASIQVRICLP